MNPATTLKDLVKLGARDVDAAVGKAAEADARMKAAAPGLGGAMGEIVSAELDRAMDTSIYEVLAHTWRIVDKVRDTAAKSRKKPVDLHNVTLGEHDFTHTVHPSVTFYVADNPVSELKLTIELVARMKSVKLGIRNAMLESVAAGKGGVVVRLKYANVKLKELPSQEIDLPGAWALRKPLAIEALEA